MAVAYPAPREYLSVTMHGGALAFAALAVNPIGGLTVAIPYAVFGLHWRAGLAYVLGVPLAYTQVIVIDVFWSQLVRIQGWNRFLARRRSARVEKLVASGGAFWLTVFFSPFIGPWLVMAFMRYAQVPHRRIALPLFLGLAWNAGAVALACAYFPQLVHPR